MGPERTILLLKLIQTEAHGILSISQTIPNLLVFSLGLFAPPTCLSKTYIEYLTGLQLNGIGFHSTVLNNIKPAT